MSFEQETVPNNQQEAENIKFAHERTRKLLRDYLYTKEAERQDMEISIEDLQDGAIDIVLKREDGAEERLSDILPREVRFFQGSEFGFFVSDDGDEYVVVPSGQAPKRTFLLRLLHEIGHSHQDKPHEQITHSRPDPFHAILALRNPLSKEEFDAHQQEVARLERDAWLYALKKLRHLKKNGWDVFAGYDRGAQELIDEIAVSLSSYELGFQFLGLSQSEGVPGKHFFTKKDIDKVLSRVEASLGEERGEPGQGEIEKEGEEG